MNTETIAVDDAIADLDDQREALAQQAAAAEVGSQERQYYAQLGRRTDKMRGALATVQSDHDLNTITLSGLTAGDSERLRDTTDDNEAGKRRIYRVCLGSVDAPWVVDDVDPLADEQQRAVADLPRGLVWWLDTQITDLSDPTEGNVQSFEELLVDAEEEAGESDSETSADAPPVATTTETTPPST